jgi:hypothetical protein
MKSPKIMFVYAAFIAICAAVAFMLAQDKSKAGTALYFGGGAAALVWVCGLMAMQIERKRAVGMIGIHVGLVLPLLFAIEFGRRAYKNLWTPEGKEYLGIIFAVMTIASVVAFIAILVTRPTKAQRGG